MHTRIFTLFFIILATCFVLTSCGSCDPDIDSELGAKEKLEPVPINFERVLAEKVRTGKLTEGQAIVLGIKVLVGERKRPEVFGKQEVHIFESTGLIRQAHDYLRTGKDKNAKKEIRRLLKVIAPSRKDLRKRSVPADRLKKGRKRPSSSGTLSRQLAKLLSPLQIINKIITEARAADPEYEYIEWGSRDQYTIYYPVAWHGVAEKMAIVDRAKAAMQDSIRKFSSYGGMSDEIGFTFEPGYKKYGMYLGAWQDSDDDNGCIIKATKKGIGLGPRKFKQAVAHEMFHCFQFINFKQQMNVKNKYNSWWVESTAYYFSNVLYPCANAEWGITKPKNHYVRGFDIGSVNRSLFEMDYENTVFIQFLANRIGDRGVLRLLSSMPTANGRSKQQRALAQFSNIDTLFHKFAQAYMDKKIADSCPNTLIPVKPQHGNRVRIKRPGQYKVKAKHFQLTRRRVLFDPGWQYQVRSNTQGPKGKHDTQEPPETEWLKLPQKITTGCGKRNYQLIVTSTEYKGSKQHTFVANVTSRVKTQIRQAKIDKCLVGTWEMKNRSHDSVVKSAISRPGMFTNFQSSGKQLTHFTKGCKATLTLKNYKTTAGISLPMIKTKTTTTVNGTDTADYIAAGGVITFSNWKQGMCDHMETKGRVRISRRKGWRNIHTVITECGPHAEGENAGKRQTSGHVGGKSYDISKMQKGYDMNKFMKQYREQARASGYGGNLKRYKPIPNMGMPMPIGKAKKEPGLFIGKAEYQCNGDRLTMRTIEPTTSDKVWEFRRVDKK